MAELVKFEVSDKLMADQLALVEKAKRKGKIKIGVNEVTKAVERGVAKLVLIAKDVDPIEVVMHLPLLCKEKNIPCSVVNTRKELGEKAGIAVNTAALAVLDEGEAKKELQDLVKKLGELSK
jgi:large subunit ribosomal protein L7Ae